MFRSSHRIFDNNTVARIAADLTARGFHLSFQVNIITCRQINIGNRVHGTCRNVPSGSPFNCIRGNGTIQYDISLFNRIRSSRLNPYMVICRYRLVIGNISLCGDLADRILCLQGALHQDVTLLVKDNIAGGTVLVLLHNNIRVNR